MSTVAECDKQATVVDLLAMVDVAKYCQQSTDDRHLLITFSVELCIQRDGQLV